METLGTYTLSAPLSCKNGGCSMWGFGEKNGKTYFIKQFLSPKHPANDTLSSTANIERRKKACAAFESNKTAIYQAINENSDGNLVRIEAFFRVDSLYYVAMKKINALPWDIAKVASLSESEKRRLCAVIAHAIACLHKGHVIHADLKHDNILFTKTPAEHVTAKIIDFDSGFLEGAPPANGEEIIGDQIYFSPEACKSFMGEPTTFTCRMDVFSLGILFHQYFSNELPVVDPAFGRYVGMAVSKGYPVILSDKLPEDIRELLFRMLQAEPEMRPTAMDVYDHLCKSIGFYNSSHSHSSIQSSTQQPNPFRRAGNL